MYPRILSRCINWAKSHGSFSVEFDEQGEEVRVFLRTVDRDTFRRVCVATLDRYSSDPHQEVSALGRLIDALGPDVWVVSISVRSTILVEAFCEYLGSGYRLKLIDYPGLDLRRFQRCLQRTASSVFGSLDGLAMTVFFVNWLKGTKTRDGMSSRPTLKGHLDKAYGYASFCGHFGQHRWCVAIDRFLFEKDGTQRWQR